MSNNKYIILLLLLFIKSNYCLNNQPIFNIKLIIIKPNTNTLIKFNKLINLKYYNNLYKPFYNLVKLKNIKNYVYFIKNIYNTYSYINDFLNLLIMYNIKYEYNDIYFKLSFIPQIYLDYLTLFNFITYFNMFNIFIILELYEIFEYFDYSIISLYNIYKDILFKNNIKIYLYIIVSEKNNLYFLNKNIR